jgi:hypothetical protein
MVHIRHCFYCGKALSRRRATKDHIRPRSKGGTDSKHNIVDACRICNEGKGNLLLDEYRQVVAFRVGVDASEYYFPGELNIMSDDAYKRRLTVQKSRRAERKATGLCMRCGKSPAKPNRVDCDPCSKLANAGRVKKKLAGVCAYCSDQNPTLPGLTLCRSCSQKSSKKNKEIVAKRKQLGLCVTCGRESSCDGQVNCEACAAEGREYHRKNKRACFDHYGRACTCCGVEFDERFLTLDHVNNDGAAHREEIGKSTLYRWAIKNKFPDSLQTHCWNCNLGKGINGGVCPHREVS